jgi:hypothetical protein
LVKNDGGMFLSCTYEKKTTPKERFSIESLGSKASRNRFPTYEK